MREYKFRAWLKEEKKMVEVLSIDFKEKRVSVPHNGDKRRPVFYDFDEVILMQYTGMKDKKGKEIYEGDVIDNSYINPMTKKTISTRYIVSFKEGGFWAELIGSDIGDMFLYWKNQDSEIIGNIYENPELLGVTND